MAPESMDILEDSCDLLLDSSGPANEVDNSLDQADHEVDVDLFDIDHRDTDGHEDFLSDKESLGDDYEDDFDFWEVGALPHDSSGHDLMLDFEACHHEPHTRQSIIENIERSLEEWVDVLLQQSDSLSVNLATRAKQPQSIMQHNTSPFLSRTYCYPGKGIDEARRFSWES
ncbi:hypothetical protein BT63DRAFT_141687 [Microthyrium microscopicum]|uniref:Uncharacterized protein n=1 Tax=Microthyrium microscopicum TaxID=703497 RepID=A0A6A6UMR8_9PEZI|nr:hypothetical protein BT63DRAFT_141687 [Microthyrium microscopicum]